MSIQKVSVEKFTRFFNRVCKMLRREVKVNSDSCAEQTFAISSSNSGRSTPTVPLPTRPSSGVATKGLERYYAKPGSAQYGC